MQSTETLLYALIERKERDELLLHPYVRLCQTTNAGSGSLVNEKEFKNAVYSIDIGQNDLAKAFYLNLSYPQVLLKIPTMLNKIEDAIKVLKVIFPLRLRKKSSETGDQNTACKSAVYVRKRR